MSTESQERVMTHGQALLEHVLALEQALSHDRDLSSQAFQAPRLDRQGPPPHPRAPPAPAVTAVSVDCPSLPPNGGKTSYATMSNYIKLTSQWVSEFNDGLSRQNNLPTAAKSGSSTNWH